MWAWAFVVSSLIKEEVQYKWPRLAYPLCPRTVNSSQFDNTLPYSVQMALGCLVGLSTKNPVHASNLAMKHG